MTIISQAAVVILIAGIAMILTRSNRDLKKAYADCLGSNLGSSLTSSVTRSKLLNLLVPQIFFCEIRIMIVPQRVDAIQ